MNFSVNYDYTSPVLPGIRINELHHLCNKLQIERKARKKCHLRKRFLGQRNWTVLFSWGNAFLEIDGRTYECSRCF